MNNLFKQKIFLFGLLFIAAFWLARNTVNSPWSSSVFYLFIILLLISFFQNRYEPYLFLVILLFNLNTQLIFSTHDELFGIIAIDEVNMIILSFILISSVKKTNPNKIIMKYQKTALSYLLVCILILIYTEVKNQYVVNMQRDYYLIIRITLRYIMYFTMFSILIKRITIKESYKVVHTVLITYAIFYSISALIYEPLYEIGLNISPESKFVDQRNTGLFVGDENFFSANLGMVFGYILGKLEKEKLKPIYLITILFIIAGVAKTGSRAGIVCLFAMTILYLYRSRGIRGMFVGSAVFIGFVILFNTIGGFIFQRLFYGVGVARGSVENFSIRVLRWGVYIDDLLKHPYYFVYGNYHPQPIFTGAHNSFITILWSCGIIFTIWFVFAIVKMFFLPKSNNPGSFRLIYLLIPFYGMLMNIDSIFYLILPILIMMSYGYEEITKYRYSRYNLI